MGLNHVLCEHISLSLSFLTLCETFPWKETQSFPSSLQNKFCDQKAPSSKTEEDPETLQVETKDATSFELENQIKWCIYKFFTKISDSLEVRIASFWKEFLWFFFGSENRSFLERIPFFTCYQVKLVTIDSSPLIHHISSPHVIQATNRLHSHVWEKLGEKL